MLTLTFHSPQRSTLHVTMVTNWGEHRQKTSTENNIIANLKDFIYTGTQSIFYFPVRNQPLGQSDSITVVTTFVSGTLEAFQQTETDQAFIGCRGCTATRPYCVNVGRLYNQRGASKQIGSHLKELFIKLLWYKVVFQTVLASLMKCEPVMN